MKSTQSTKNQEDTRSTHSDLAECLLSCLNEREQDVLQRRYAFSGGKKETLEAIGEDYDITRERVRQIERSSLQKIKRLQDYKDTLKEIIVQIDAKIDEFGGIIAHHHLVEELLHNASETEREVLQKEKNRLLFLLEEFMSEFFCFKKASEIHLDGWSKNEDSFKSLRNVLERIEAYFKAQEKPVSHKSIAKHLNEPLESVYSYLHLSSNVAQNAFGLWGFDHWAEVNPKRMADRIFLVLKKYGEPLHYKDIATAIEKYYHKKTHPPTVHNELIADPRFVLVGRGIYGLREWGYVSGTVRDVVETLLKETRSPLTRDEIIDAVCKQRIVARSTILLALNSNPRIEKVGYDSYAVK